MTHPEEGVEVYVGFWARAGASLLDTLLWLLVVTPLLWWIYGSELFDTEAFRAGGWDVVISWLMPAIATILFWVYRSATPGKMAIGARVVDARTGARPSTLQLIGRYLGYYVSATPLGLGCCGSRGTRGSRGGTTSSPGRSSSGGASRPATSPHSSRCGDGDYRARARPPLLT